MSKWEPEKYGYIKTDFVIGHSRKFFDTDQALTSHKRQEIVLSKFRNNVLNLLVATSVLEEGIDIKHCNLVIRYDPPNDFRSFVQVILILKS